MEGHGDTCKLRCPAVAAFQGTQGRPPVRFPEPSPGGSPPLEHALSPALPQTRARWVTVADSVVLDFGPAHFPWPPGGGLCDDSSTHVKGVLCLKTFSAQEGHHPPPRWGRGVGAGVAETCYRPLSARARPKVVPYLPDMPLLHYLGTQHLSGYKTAGSGDSRCSELPEGRSRDSGPDGPRCRLSSSCCLASGRALVRPGPRAKSAPPHPPPGGRPCVGSQWRDGHPLYCEDSPRHSPWPTRPLRAAGPSTPPPAPRAMGPSTPLRSTAQLLGQDGKP